MPKITFITPDHETITIEDAQGTLMEIATFNDVDGIEGACGGVCSCATCHLRIPPEWRDKVGPATPAEQTVFDFQPDAGPDSRLGCQIELTDDLDGLVVEVVGSR
jgi:2Fe-2S ferredoxin